MLGSVCWSGEGEGRAIFAKMFFFCPAPKSKPHETDSRNFSGEPFQGGSSVAVLFLCVDG